MLWLEDDSTMVGENFEFCISLMLRNAHNANIFNLEFYREKFTLTFLVPPLLKEVPLLYEPPLLRFFSSPPPFVSEPKSSSPPPFKKGGGRELCIDLLNLALHLVPALL